MKNRKPANTWAGQGGSPPRSTSPLTSTSLRSRVAGSGSGSTRRVGVKIVAGVVAAIVGLAAIWWIVSSLGSGDDTPAAAAVSVSQTSRAQSPQTVQEVLQCEEEDTAQRMQSSGEGDLSTQAGLIVAYEHAYFALRDARAMEAMSKPGPRVATASRLDQGLAATPENTPWCVTVVPSGSANVFTVTVRYVDFDETSIMTWNQEMTVERQDPRNQTSPWKVVAARDIT